MEKIVKKVRIINKVEVVFKIWFLLYTMLSVCNVFYGKSIISIVMWPMLLVGGSLLCYRMVCFREYIKMPALIWLIGLLASFVISMLFNWKYGLKDNLVTFVLWCLYFGLLYTRKESDCLQTIKKEFRIVTCVYMTYVNIGIIISFIMMFLGYQHVYTNQRGYEVAAGLIWGRLWGVFIDPNSAAVMACVSIALAMYFLKRENNKIIRAFIVFAIVIDVFYIAFSDSRTGRVALSMIFFGYYFLCILYKKSEQRTRQKVISVVLLIVLSVGVFFIPKAVSNSYNAICNILENSDSGQESYEKIKRGYDLDEDISNRRFDIWESGIEILGTSPVLGTSFGGLRRYAEDNLPGTYIVNNDYKKFNTLDNEILNVVVAQGIVGGIFLLGFLVTVLRKIFTQLKYLEKQEFEVIAIWVAILGAISSSAMFRATMFYHSSPNANIFWMVLGYVMFIVDKKGKEVHNGTAD